MKRKINMQQALERAHKALDQADRRMKEAVEFEAQSPVRKDRASDTRYPYTYAADYVRTIAGHNEHGTKLSRSDASAIRHAIAEILELNDELVARELADYYLEHEEELDNRAVKNFLLASGMMEEV